VTHAMLRRLTSWRCIIIIISCNDVVAVCVGVTVNVSVSPCSCSDIVAVCVGVAVKSATSSFTARPLLQVLVACVVVVLQLLGY